MTVRVANAPCSCGAFEFTVGIDPNVPDGIGVLDSVAAAGYAGIDLGPVDYLGDRSQLGERLAARNLTLAGGYVPLPFSDPEALKAQIGYLDSMLDILDATQPGEFKARPTLADASSPPRLANPGVAAVNRELGLDEAGWQRFGAGLDLAVAKCRERGYEPTFHHHLGTYVEAVWEIERVLELSDVGLCLDTGHLLLGRGDPVTAIRAWGGRINQVHLKDARIETLEQIVAEAAPVREIWARRAFRPLG